MRSAKMALFRSGQNVIYVCLVVSLFVGSLNAECCKDGETKIDEDDCTKYQVCCTGEFVSKSCPNGTYWDPETELCQIDNGECRPPTPCVDGETEVDADDCTKYFVCCHGELVSKSCDNGFYWNSDAQNCDLDNGQCKPPTCENGEVNPNPEDCAGYQECVNGAWVNKSCSAGDYFNSTLNECVLDTCGACVNCVEGSKKPDQYDCAKFQICVNGKYVSESCPIGEYFNSAINDCEQDNGQCNGNQTCTEGDIQEDVEDCAGYEVCSNGNWVSRKCPTGEYFNKTNGTCIIDGSGVCLNCTEGTTGPVPSDCTKYKICAGGKYVVQSCAGGLYFNNQTNRCEIDNGECVVVPSCKESEVEVNPADCAGFLECINGNFVARKCAATLFFNETLMECVKDTENVCIPKDCDPECCENPNAPRLPVANNCSAFIQCVDGKVFQHTCANNLQYNPETGDCDYPWVVGCEDGAPPPIAGPSGTYCESHGNCINERDGAMFASSSKPCSSSYVVCQCECEVNFTCSAGLIFNPAIKVCDWPQNVKC
ncbi:hypothetical protein KR067_005485 [Drosophila pandora]|nr:hypothetical protein KR067_005485 [Drosophila pandora]